jgi:uncharacterized OsmC-like protein
MFNLVLAPGSRIDVTARNHAYAYATDGSLPNPLESTYAALAGCSGVYAKKACRELGIDDAGIAIAMKIVARPEKPLIPARFVTTVQFPERFDAEQRAAILASIRKCAVKAIIEHGAEIDFEVA